MPKHILIVLDNAEYKKFSVLKKDMSWRDLLLSTINFHAEKKQGVKR